MNTRRTIKWVSIVAIPGVIVFVLMMLPRTRSLPEGYTYAYFPRSGHRFLIAPGGIKKLGQEVLDYQVSGTVVAGPYFHRQFPAASYLFTISQRGMDSKGTGAIAVREERARVRNSGRPSPPCYRARCTPDEENY